MSLRDGKHDPKGAPNQSQPRDTAPAGIVGNRGACSFAGELVTSDKWPGAGANRARCINLARELNRNRRPAMMIDDARGIRGADDYRISMFSCLFDDRTVQNFNSYG